VGGRREEANRKDKEDGEMKRLIAVSILIVGLLVGMTVGANAATNRDAWIPGIASFLIPGLGQLLNDQVDKAIIHFGIGMAIPVGGALAVSVLPFNLWTAGYSVVALATIGFRVYSGLDAYNVAEETGFSIGLRPNGVAVSYHF
jgi:TM2 domain-containing membrane protein YozV